MRCSNPAFVLEDLAPVLDQDRQPRLCEEDPEYREEWYGEGELCPKCTGEADVPKTEPLRTLEQSVMNGLDDEQRAGVSRRAMEYLQNLAYWLFASMSLPGSPLSQVGRPANNAEDERRIGVLNELICQANPEHGSPYRLQASREGEFWFETLAYDCDCLATQNPSLSN